MQNRSHNQCPHCARPHYRGKLDLEQLTDSHARYSAARRLIPSRNSRRFVLAPGIALARRLAGAGVTGELCLHPGVVATNLLPRRLRTVKPLISQVIDPSSANLHYLAMAGEVAGTSGCHFDERHAVQLALGLERCRVQVEVLWNSSAHCTGVRTIRRYPRSITELKDHRGVDDNDAETYHALRPVSHLFHIQRRSVLSVRRR